MKTRIIRTLVILGIGALLPLASSAGQYFEMISGTTYYDEIVDVPSAATCAEFGGTTGNGSSVCNGPIGDYGCGGNGGEFHEMGDLVEGDYTVQLITNTQYGGTAFSTVQIDW